jgi:hypothetical protein
MSTPRPTNAAAANRHSLISIGRIILGALLLMVIAWFGGVLFEGLDPQDLALNFITRHPTLKIIPLPQFYTVLLNKASWRYMIAPLGGMFAVFLGAAYYVKDIYALDRLREAVNFIISSMFALSYPSIGVAAGSVQIAKGKTNLIDTIGGPGYCSIQPGNVVLFRNLRRPSNITLSQSYFMEPFEKIGHVADLQDQHDDRTGITALTRDGIKVTITDVHFRYRIFPAVKNEHPIRRSPSEPYPFDEQALWRMAYNLVVEETGLETWRKAVGRVIVGGITDFINDHDIDYLTAPRENRQDPRREIRHRLFFGGPRMGLRNLGADLLWVDIGHFSIDEDKVDEIRQDYWAADWLGEARITRELGLAKRQAYQDLGRAEAQAELIVAIADSLKLTNNSIDPASNMRKILIIRTAQLLDAFDNEANKSLEFKKP